MCHKTSSGVLHSSHLQLLMQSADSGVAGYSQHGVDVVVVITVRLRQGCGVDATPSLGLSPPPYFTSNKSTADIKSPCSRRAGIISFVNTMVFMDIGFLHHFK